MCSHYLLEEEGGEGGHNIWFDLIYFPRDAAGSAAVPELSPNFSGAAFMRRVWMIEISPHKITLTQLLHCHTELSRAVDLIPWKAFVCHWVEEEEEDDEEEETDEREPTCTSIRTSCIQKEAGDTELWFLLCPAHSPAVCKCMARHNL